MRARILVAVICVPAVVAVLLFLPVWATGVLVGLIAAVAALEFVLTTKAAGNIRVVCYCVASAFAIPVVSCLEVEALTGVFVMTLLLLALFIEALIAFGTDRPISLSQISLAFLGGAVIPFMLSALVTLRTIPEGYGEAAEYFDGRIYALIPFLIAFISDGGAYFTGRAFGRHKLIEKISPNKTVEGAIGGFAFALLGMIGYCLVMVLAFDAAFNPVMLVVYPILGSAVTQVGDLAFSMVKREYDKKDFGNLLPGHGGMLDRFDSMVMLAPVICALVLWFPVFTLG